MNKSIFDMLLVKWEIKIEMMLFGQIRRFIKTTFISRKQLPSCKRYLCSNIFIFYLCDTETKSRGLEVCLNIVHSPCPVCRFWVCVFPLQFVQAQRSCFGGHERGDWTQQLGFTNPEKGQQKPPDLASGTERKCCRTSRGHRPSRAQAACQLTDCRWK